MTKQLDIIQKRKEKKTTLYKRLEQEVLSLAIKEIKLSPNTLASLYVRLETKF